LEADDSYLHDRSIKEDLQRLGEGNEIVEEPPIPEHDETPIAELEVKIAGV
jgi:hypothetical protein